MFYVAKNNPFYITNLKYDVVYFFEKIFHKNVKKKKTKNHKIIVNHFQEQNLYVLTFEPTNYFEN